MDNKISKDRGVVGRDSLVTVDLFKRINDTYYMMVKLRSVVRPELISYYSVDLDKHTSERDFLYEVGVAGGALAERQNENYLDHHDPAECVKAAVEVAAELMRGI